MSRLTERFLSMTETDNLVTLQIDENDSTIDASPVPEEQPHRNRYKKASVAVVLVAFIAYVIADSLTTKHVSTAATDFLEWIEANPVPGLFVFMLVYFVATVFLVPGSILTLGSGFVFSQAFGLGLGVLLGVVAVVVGASAGAIAAFLIGRYLLRSWVRSLSEKYDVLEAFDTAFEEKGLRIMLLLRLSPIVPYNVLNYISGLTSISLWHYTIALIAILPGTTLYVFLGASAGSLADTANRAEDSTVTIIIVVVGVILGIGAVAMTSYYAKKQLNRIAEMRIEVPQEATTGTVIDC